MSDDTGEVVSGVTSDDRQYSWDLAMELRQAGFRQPPGPDRSLMMMCAGYLAGLAIRIHGLERENKAVVLANRMLGERDESFRQLLRVCEGYLVDVNLQYGDQYHGGLGDAIKSIREIGGI